MALTKVTGDFIKDGVLTQAHLHTSHGITTAHIGEGSNLYFTNARVDSRIGDLSTSNLSEGSNLYYTDARARAAISVSGNALSYNSSTGVITSNFEESPTFSGNVVINGSGSSGNAINVTRGSDGTTALRVQNTGEVVTQANYFYATGPGVSMYVQNTAVFRGSILNDGSNAPVRIADDLTIDSDLTVTGGDITLGGTGRIQGIDTVSAGTDAANKTYVDNQVAGIVDSAPSTLDTLNELAAALGDDANFSTTVTNSIATKMPLAGGTFTGFIQLGSNQLRFDQSGTRSWTVSAAGGNLNINSGDSLGNVAITSGLTVQDASTFASDVTINSAGDATSPILRLNNSSSNLFNHALEAINANITAGETELLLFGKATSTRNSGFIGYNWVGDNNNNNFVSIGHWSYNHLFRVYPDQVLSTLTLRGNVDMQAPVFYDKDNTTYFIDPASNNSIKTVGDWRSDSSTWSGEFAGKMQYHSNWWYIQTTNGVFIRNASGANNITLSAAGNITANTDVRSPIFYDSADTTYYTDPASRSNLFTLDLNAGTVWDATTQGTSKGALHLDPNSATDHAGAAITFGASDHNSGQSADAGIYIRSDGTYGTRMYLSTTDSYASGSKTTVRLEAAGGLYVDRGNFYAPLFYDLNNTGYYVDPASTSNLYDFQLTGSKHTYLYVNPGNGYEAMTRYNGGSGSTWYVGSRTSTDLIGSTDAWHVYSQTAGRTVSGTDTGGNAFAYGSFRAPIFYDSNDTNYYTDPASTSYVKYLGRRQHQSGHFVGSYNNIGGNSAKSNPIYTIGSSYNPNETNLGGMYGIGYAHPNLSAWGSGKTSDWGFYVANNGTIDATIGDGAVTAWFASQVHAAGDFRAPIYYDLNDTSFQVDPNSTSNFLKIKSSSAQAAPRWDTAFYVLQSQHWYGDTSSQDMFIGESGNNINVRGKITYSGGQGAMTITNSSILSAAASSWTGDPGANGKIQYHSNRWYIVSDSSSNRIVQFRRDGSDKCYIDNDGRLMDVEDVRAYLYYDRNDTGYYADPAGTSNFFKLETKRHAVTGTSVPTYHEVGIEIVTNSNGVPALGFHRGGYSATTLYEYDGELYVNAWVSRAQSGKLLSTGNIHNTIYSGSWMGSNFAGTRFAGYSTDGGEIAFLKNNPSGGKNSILVDGSYYAGENGGYWSIWSGNNYNNRVGIYGDTSGNLQIGTSTSENVLRTNYGYIQMGPMNSSHAHIYTDRSNFYFNKQIQLLGGTLINQNDVQATIFYDRSDTGKYCDPNGVSQFSGLTVANRISGTIDGVGISGYGTNSISFQQTSGSFAGRSGWHNHIIMNHGNGASYYNTIISMDFFGDALYHSRLQGGSFSGPYKICSAGSGFTSGQEINSSLRMKASEYWDYNNTNYYAHLDATGFSIRIAGTVQSNYSDIQLKDVIENIPNALDKVNQLNGFYYYPNEIAQGYGYDKKKEVGLSAQDVEAVLPEIVSKAPVSDKYKTIQYERVVPLLVEAIKELKADNDSLRARIETLENQ